MLDSYENALAKGTVANKVRQAKLYIKFSIIYKFNCLNPNIINLGMYARFLANSFTSPTTCKNYMSGAKSWVRDHGGPISSFESYHVATVIKGIQTSSTHVPSPAPPILQKELHVIVSYIDRYFPHLLNVKAAVLLGFCCMLRSSNLLAPTVAAWAGPHTLYMSDVSRVHSGLRVAIRSSKTFKNKPPVILDVCEAPGSILCPVSAWVRYVRVFKPPISGVAFRQPSGSPLTARPVVDLIRQALQFSGYPNYNQFSLHSLRRGAAHTAALLGVPNEHIKVQGTWTSDAGLNYYLPPNMVPKSLASALALPPC